jgi:hypothetical protein
MGRSGEGFRRSVFGVRSYAIFTPMELDLMQIEKWKRILEVRIPVDLLARELGFTAEMYWVPSLV